MSPVFSLFILAVSVWFWFDSLRTREVAMVVCKRVCTQFHLQFLDDSVVLIRLRLKRNQHGHLSIQRTYLFDFYDKKESRQQGTLLIRGITVEMLELPGYMNRTISPV